MIAGRGSTREILQYLRNNDYLTSNMAWERWGVTRLASIIHKLRRAGYDIETVRVDTITRFGEHTNYARYILKGDK